MMLKGCDWSELWSPGWIMSRNHRRGDSTGRHWELEVSVNEAKELVRREQKY